MAQRIPIRLHVGNALQWLGTLYRNPADALKEHVSNAIDEHVKAKLDGSAHERCDVLFTLDRRHVTVEYPYGMSRTELETALQRVADSAKRAGSARTIGRLGIGIFSFQQIGRRCTFYTRKTIAAETLRMVLKEGSDEATVETALAREALSRPGLRVVISELKFDPTRSRGPLASDTLRRYLAEKFDAYLREGWLTIEIRTGIARFAVTPSRIRLPRLLADVRELALPHAADKKVRLELYFDPSGRGRVAIRHHGVTVVENLSALSAYGLEESAWALGFVSGVLDADFLSPLPARSGFDENDDWVAVLDLLDRYLPTLEAELGGHLAAYRSEQAAAIGERALRLARDILDLDEFRDLALPG
jgi:Histidine kinase-, DNA gyrase B-, and HSP90-like ATPase